MNDWNRHPFFGARIVPRTQPDRCPRRAGSPAGLWCSWLPSRIWTNSLRGERTLQQSNLLRLLGGGYKSDDVLKRKPANKNCLSHFKEIIVLLWNIRMLWEPTHTSPHTHAAASRSRPSGGRLGGWRRWGRAWRRQRRGRRQWPPPDKDNVLSISLLCTTNMFGFVVHQCQPMLHNK